MHHIAIMNKSWKLIPKIISGEKTIESRWYQTKRAPWNKIKKGDIVYFKNAGEKVVTSVRVEDVKQFSFTDVLEVKGIIKKYGKDICLVNSNVETWDRRPKYCILIFIKYPQTIKIPFDINKKGFGLSTAWITVGDIESVKQK